MKDNKKGVREDVLFNSPYSCKTRRRYLSLTYKFDIPRPHSWRSWRRPWRWAPSWGSWWRPPPSWRTRPRSLRPRPSSSEPSAAKGKIFSYISRKKKCKPPFSFWGRLGSASHSIMTFSTICNKEKLRCITSNILWKLWTFFSFYGTWSRSYHQKIFQNLLLQK